MERKDEGVALAQLVLRVATRREYLGNEQVRTQVLAQLNAVLALEGCESSRQWKPGKAVEYDTDHSRPTAKNPVELTASLEQIVGDKKFGEQLRRTLDEAYCCWRSGAPTAAIIMLGSLLEGVLYDVAIQRYKVGKPPSDHLASLIDLARRQKWITQDVVDYAHVLRNHRNLVHPKKQYSEEYSPDGDTVLIAWNVVVAALNDLAELARAVK